MCVCVCGLPSNTIATRAVCMRGYDDEAHIYIDGSCLFAMEMHCQNTYTFFSYVPRGYLCKMIFAQIYRITMRNQTTHIFPLLEISYNNVRDILAYIPFFSSSA